MNNLIQILSVEAIQEKRTVGGVFHDRNIHTIHTHIHNIYTHIQYIDVHVLMIMYCTIIKPDGVHVHIYVCVYIHIYIYNVCIYIYVYIYIVSYTVVMSTNKVSEYEHTPSNQ